MPFYRSCEAVQLTWQTVKSKSQRTKTFKRFKLQQFQTSHRLHLHRTRKNSLLIHKMPRQKRSLQRSVFVLTLFCFASTCCLHRRFSSFSSRFVMPCFVTYSLIVTVLRTTLNFLSGLFFAVHIHRLFLLRPMLNCTVPLSTLPQNVLFCSLGGNLVL